MNNDETQMAAFLADPDGPATNAYAAWLDAQNNKIDTQRAEYLRLVTGLQQPPASNRPNPRNWRLYILRGRVPAQWADQIDATRIATDGVYQSEPLDGAWHYLRFYPDKSVLSLCSSQTPEQAWQTFDQLKSRTSDDHTFGRGVYSISYSNFSFTQVQQAPNWMQPAWRNLCEQRLMEEEARGDFDMIAADMAVRQRRSELEQEMKTEHYTGDPSRQTLRLAWHRCIDDSRAQLTYQFIPMAARGLAGQHRE